MDLETLKKIIQNRENEIVEFKEWKSTISVFGRDKLENRRDCLLGYCVGIGNAGGGHLAIGVRDDGSVVGTLAKMPKNVAKQIFDRTGQHIIVDEFNDESDKRVIVVTIPSRRKGERLRFAGVPLMRISDSLEIMTEAEEERIIMEGHDDFSARVCENSSVEDVDMEAMKKLRELYLRKNPENKTAQRISDEQLLSDLCLMRKGKLTYAGVILVATEEFLKWNLADAEVCFEYRNKASDGPYNDRVDYRKAFVLSAVKIWEKIASRQQVHPIIEGMFRNEIPAFNEEVFREALFNAVCHRDYSRQGSICIKQSPEQIEIVNPGGFLPGITPQNLVYVPSTPRNRSLAEALQKIFQGVERSGQGADKIFRLTIEEGKGAPDYSESSPYEVRLTIPATLKDENFVKYLNKVSEEEQISLSLEDILILENIRTGSRKGITLKVVKHLIDKGLVELHGKTRGAKYILSRRFYSDSGKLGERTKRIGLPRNKIKEVILEHIRINKMGTRTELQEIFPELEPSNITNLLQELKRSGKIERSGNKTRGASWKLNTK